jgi:hypothetical protein
MNWTHDNIGDGWLVRKSAMQYSDGPDWAWRSMRTGCANTWAKSGPGDDRSVVLSEGEFGMKKTESTWLV